MTKNVSNKTPLEDGADFPSRPSGATSVRGRAGRTGRGVVWVVLIDYGQFSVIPMAWLILASSKTATQLNDDHPFSFGTFANYAIAWEHLLPFQDGVIGQWLLNSIWYMAAIAAIG